MTVGNIKYTRGGRDLTFRRLLFRSLFYYVRKKFLDIFAQLPYNIRIQLGEIYGKSS